MGWALRSALTQTDHVPHVLVARAGHGATVRGLGKGSCSANVGISCAVALRTVVLVGTIAPWGTVVPGSAVAPGDTVAPESAVALGGTVAP